MRIKSIPASWIEKYGYRFDCNPYMGGAVEVKIALETMRRNSSPLRKLVASRFGGIYHAGRYKRIWVESEEYGLPFLSSRDVLQSDLSKVSFISKKSIDENLKLLIHKDQILITRSGTVGRMSYVNSFMDGMSCTEHVIRVEADSKKVKSGYLYAFLNSSYGIPLVLVGTYGAIIRHIEPEHIENMPVPRLGQAIEEKVDALVKESSDLRSEFQVKINQATSLLFDSAGLKDITPSEWHSQGPDIGYEVTLKNSNSMRALNFCSRYQRLLKSLKSVVHKTLGSICDGGELSRGGRFRRVDATPEFGIQLIGQKQGFWFKPEGRWIAPRYAKEEIVVPDETVVIASQGTLGEREVFCRPILVTGRWLEYGFSEHFLRVYSNDSQISGAYLYAFLRSETAFRCLRSMSIGSKQQDIHLGMLSELPVPIIAVKDMRRVENLIRMAFKEKDLAEAKEQQAIKMVEKSILSAVK